MTPSGVMRLQAGIKVFGKTCVESFLIDLRLKDVNVVELHRLRFSPGPKRSRNEEVCFLGGVPGRSFETPNNNHCPPSPRGFGAAYFALTKISK